MNAERRIQRVRAALPPVGGSQARLADPRRCRGAMGSGASRSASPRRSGTRCAPCRAGARGMTYARLDVGRAPVAVPGRGPPGHGASCTRTFAHGPRARCARSRTSRRRSGRRRTYPFLLTTGRTLYQFNAGTMTMRTPNASSSPATCSTSPTPMRARLGVADGDRVRVVRAYGAAVLPAQVSGAVRPGQLFATFHTAEVFLNRSPARIATVAWRRPNTR